MTDFGRRPGDMLRSVYDANQDGVIAVAQTEADMKKSVYDANDDGVVSDSDKLQASSKTQVQNHPPTPHTHLEAHITNLVHDATKILGVNVSDTWKADDKGLYYNVFLDRLEYRTATTPLPHAGNHEDGGSDEIDATGLVGRTNFVDRGDPSGFDFTLANLTTDGQLHDIDFSSIVPAGAVAAYLTIQVKDNLVGSVIYLIKKGNTHYYNRLMVRTQAANATIQLTGFVSIDVNRKAQYWADLTTFDRIDIVVRGWLI